MSKKQPIIVTAGVHFLAMAFIEVALIILPGSYARCVPKGAEPVLVRRADVLAIQLGFIDMSGNALATPEARLPAAIADLGARNGHVHQRIQAGLHGHQCQTKDGFLAVHAILHSYRFFGAANKTALFALRCVEYVDVLGPLHLFPIALKVGPDPSVVARIAVRPHSDSRRGLREESKGVFVDKLSLGLSDRRLAGLALEILFGHGGMDSMFGEPPLGM